MSVCVTSSTKPILTGHSLADRRCYRKKPRLILFKIFLFKREGAGWLENTPNLMTVGERTPFASLRFIFNDTINYQNRFPTSREPLPVQKIIKHSVKNQNNDFWTYFSLLYFHRRPEKIPFPQASAPSVPYIIFMCLAITHSSTITAMRV